MEKHRYRKKFNICIICGKKFHPRYNAPKAQHCSMKCGWVTRRKLKPPQKIKRCSISGCNNLVYAKGFCRKHYNNYRKNGNPIPYFGKRIEEKCIICGSTFVKTKSSKKKTCSSACGKLIHKINFSGEQNPRWSGGKSQYKNHHIMKKNRIIKLKKTKGMCEICKKRATIIHHIDGTKNNHSLDNLLCLCAACHGVIHTGRKNKISKFIKIYGRNVDEISNEHNISQGYVYRLHQTNKLKEFLKMSC